MIASRISGPEIDPEFVFTTESPLERFFSALEPTL